MVRRYILDGLVVSQDIKELGDGVRRQNVLVGRIEVGLE
jgi:hypothetical protein